MVTTSRTGISPQSVLEDVVEPARKAARISLRAAAERAGMSEGTWRQLVAGGVMQRGTWVPRHPRRDQVLDMAASVQVFEEVAALLDASQEERRDSQMRVVILDPAEEEIMAMRALRPREKLALLEELRNLRAESQ